MSSRKLHEVEDLIREIVSYIVDIDEFYDVSPDFKTLVSLAQVNRAFCRVVLPIIWESLDSPSPFFERLPPSKPLLSRQRHSAPNIQQAIARAKYYALHIEHLSFPGGDNLYELPSGTAQRFLHHVAQLGRPVCPNLKSLYIGRFDTNLLVARHCVHPKLASLTLAWDEIVDNPTKEQVAFLRSLQSRVPNLKSLSILFETAPPSRTVNDKESPLTELDLLPSLDRFARLEEVSVSGLIEPYPTLRAVANTRIRTLRVTELRWWDDTLIGQPILPDPPSNVAGTIKLPNLRCLQVDGSAVRCQNVLNQIDAPLLEDLDVWSRPPRPPLSGEIITLHKQAARWGNTLKRFSFREDCESPTLSGKTVVDIVKDMPQLTEVCLTAMWHDGPLRTLCRLWPNLKKLRLGSGACDRHRETLLLDELLTIAEHSHNLTELRLMVDLRECVPPEKLPSPSTELKKMFWEHGSYVPPEESWESLAKLLRFMWPNAVVVLPKVCPQACVLDQGTWERHKDAMDFCRWYNSR